MKYTLEEIRTHRAEWVAALRSGQYPKTTLTLRDESGYCCLGVAASLTPGVEEEPVTLEDGDIQYWYDGEKAVLPTATMEWLGLLSPSPTTHVGRLSSLNDGVGLSFEEIADLIEDQDDDWDGNVF